MSRPDHPSTDGAASRERWVRLRAIAEQALDTAPEARDALLTSACGDDPALRADVEALVRACESAERSSSFLATPAPDLAEPMLESTLRLVLADRYTVLREIGRGGMARVYLALDRRHNRSVAIKLLNPELGALLGVERFLAEIEVTASLQHPNALALFDSGEANGLLYYVMPFVEGESLRARLQRERQLPVDEAVRIATAIAGALDYAHRRGIVHRDLKPENILLQEGEPLVADFGIALALSKAGGERLTQAGSALGTPAYMSPEQAAAEGAIDARSDVYALGCVLYELLSGDPPHTGGSVHTVIRKVISETPLAVRVLRPTVPAHVDSAIQRALAKIPADRFDSARDFAAALAGHSSATEALMNDAQAPREMSAKGRTRLRDPLVVSLGGLALAGCALALWLFTRERAETPPRTTRFVVGALTTAPVGGMPTVTPDGRYLVYAGPEAVGRRVFVRGFDQLEARTIPGVQNAVSTFVSPDGRWIGYFTGDDKLEKVPIDGGTPTLLGGGFRFSRARWSRSGVIVTDSYGQQGLAWIADSGGTRHPLTSPNVGGGELSHMAAYVLPDDRSVVFTVQRQRGGPSPVVGELAVVALDSLAASPMRHTMLGVNGRCAIAYVYGFLLYTGLDGATIMAVRYDAATRKILGAPVAVLREPDGDIDGADLSHDGTLVYTRRNGTNAPVLVGADGARMPLLGHAAGSFMHPRYSPDGRKIALAGLSPQGSDVFIYDVASRTSTRLTTTGNAYLPFWMPDGRRVVFLSTRSGNDAFWAQIADGSSPPEKLVEFPGIFAGTATPDGRALLYQRQDRRVWGIWTAKLEGDRSQHPVLTESFDDYMPALSHDGRWLAYTSNASGREEVYVRSYPASSAPVQISDAGGKEPVWSRDGRRLYYRSGRQLVAATVATEREFAVASRAPMIDDAFDGGMPHANYDAAPDGRGLLVLSSQDKSGPETIVVVNWLAELRAKLAGAP